jgi:hypothetical protein
LAITHFLSFVLKAPALVVVCSGMLLLYYYKSPFPMNHCSKNVIAMVKVWCHLKGLPVVDVVANGEAIQDKMKKKKKKAESQVAVYSQG